MKEPICEICGRDDEGGYVSFANYEPLPDGMLGHPSGFEFFCSVHLNAARQLNYLSSHEAILRLKSLPKQDLKDD